MSPSQTETADPDALGKAIAACTSPAIVLWARSEPRIGTLRPMARALVQAGYDAFLVYSSKIKLAPAELAGDIPCFQASPERVSRLTHVAMFISVEHNIADGPQDAIRFAIHHSLPDYRLQRDYANLLANSPIASVSTDYYAIVTRQRDKHWTIENYAQHIDGVFPDNMLAGRRDTLTVVPFGYPKIDRLMADDTSGIQRDTITYAPTQSTMHFGSVKTDGAEILNLLLREFPDHRIAFRPYPGLDLKRLKNLIDSFRDRDRFHLDDTPTGHETMQRSALVVTDRSSVAVSFALGLARPVVFFRAGGLKGTGDPGLEPVDPIGLRAGSIAAIGDGVRRMLNGAEAQAELIRASRGDVIYNPGRSLDYLLEIMPDVIAGRSRETWLSVPRRPLAGKTQAARAAALAALRAKLKARDAKQAKLTMRILKQGFLGRTTPVAPPPDPFAKRLVRYLLRRNR